MHIVSACLPAYSMWGEPPHELCFQISTKLKARVTQLLSSLVSSAHMHTPNGVASSLTRITALASAGGLIDDAAILRAFSHLIWLADCLDCVSRLTIVVAYLFPRVPMQVCFPTRFSKNLDTSTDQLIDY